MTSRVACPLCDREVWRGVCMYNMIRLVREQRRDTSAVEGEENVTETRGGNYRRLQYTTYDGVSYHIS